MITRIKLIFVGLAATAAFTSACQKADTKQNNVKVDITAKLDSIEKVIMTAQDAGDIEASKLATLAAIDNLQQFIVAFPNDSLTPEYSFKRAQLVDNVMGDKPFAIKLYAETATKYPVFKDRPQVLFFWGNAYHEEGDTTMAVEKLLMLVKEYPTTGQAKDAQQLIDFIRMKDEDRSKIFNIKPKSPNEDSIFIN